MTSNAYGPNAVAVLPKTEKEKANTNKLETYMFLTVRVEDPEDERSLKTDKFVLIAHGSMDDTTHAKEIPNRTQPEALERHE
jgi:hypothetical protein